MELLRILADQAHDPLIAIDVDSKIIEWNQHAESKLGWSREAVLGKGMPEIIIPERMRERHYRGMRRYLETGVGPLLNKRVEVPVLKKDGHELTMEIIISKLKGRRSNIFCASLQDISDRKLVERLMGLRLNLTQILGSTTTIPEGITKSIQVLAEAMDWKVATYWELESGGASLRCAHAWTGEPEKFRDFTRVSEGIAYAPGEGLPGSVWHQQTIVYWPLLAVEEMGVRALSATNESLQSGIALPIGTDQNFLGVIEFFSSKTLKPPPSVYELLLDIGSQLQQFVQKRQTEEKLKNLYKDLEQKVAERTRDISLIVRNAPIVFWRIDRNGVITTLEGRGLEYSKFRKDSVVGKYIWQVFSTRPDILDQFRRALAGEEFRAEVRIGEFWYETTLTPLRDDNGKVVGVMGVSPDITDRKKIEIELMAAKEAAEAANRAKSQFLANMSHEIRTPLGAILGFSELLVSKGQAPEDQQVWSEKIKSNGVQLLTIIDQILDLSKVEAGHAVPEIATVEMPRVIEEIRSVFGSQAKSKGLAFGTSVEGDIPQFIRTDLAKFRQIFNNIIGNAIKFTEHGYVNVLIKMTGDRKLALFVSDSGIGLSDEEARKIFRPFTQADASATRRFGGTGLGLALSKDLAEVLGGDVSLVGCEKGRGCTFAIKIDVGALEGVPKIGRQGEGLVPESKPAEKIPRLDGSKILVVEDSEDNRTLISRFLENAGARVDLANNGEEGLQRALHDSYDVVLMDMQMPVRDGLSATRELRRRGYVKPIVALTAHAMKEDRDRCLSAGCDDHITKPIKRSDLIKKLAEINVH